MSRPAWERATLALLVVYFALRAIHLAWVTPASIPPDEFSHFGRAVVFSQAAWLPPDGPDSYRYGLMRDTPYLYSLAMGKLLALNALPIDDLRFLRLVNVVIGVLTVWIAMRAMALLSSDPIARVLFGVMLTNTLMLTFLSASVSYDNGANLCAALAFACLFAFLRWQRPAHLAGLALALLAGTLTKKTLLPLAALMVVVLLWRERSRLRGHALRGAAWLRGRPAQAGAAALAIAVLAALNVGLYGGNLVRHGSLIPDCRDVLALEQCLERPNFARNWVAERYRAGEIDEEEAARAAAVVAHPRIRANTLYLVRTWRAWTQNGRPAVDRFHYAFVWADMMLKGSTGVLGHRSFSQSGPRRAAYLALFLGAGVVFARRWRPGDAAGTSGVSAVITALYALILMQLVNYATYLGSGSITLAAQGRYLFPVLVPFYGLVARYAVEFLPTRWAIAVAVAASGVFLAGDLPFYLAARDAAWVGGP